MPFSDEIVQLILTEPSPWGATAEIFGVPIVCAKETPLKANNKKVATKKYFCPDFMFF
jgi:hypothetical protein